MTALPPTTDEEWDDLRRRYPSTLSTAIKLGGYHFFQAQIDALRAAGVWCEHEDLSITEAAAAVHGGRPKPHTYAVGVSSTRPSGPATVGLCPTAGCRRTDPHISHCEPAPVERFTTKRHPGRIQILDNGKHVQDFFLHNYVDRPTAQEAADACVAILRQKHAEPEPRWRVDGPRTLWVSGSDTWACILDTIHEPDDALAERALKAAADVLNGAGKPTNMRSENG